MNSILSVVSQIEVDAKVFGYKAAADIAFSKLGVGAKHLVFPPSARVKEIVEATLREFGVETKLVVRFSYKNEINLPVGIGVSGGELLQFISTNKKPHYSTLVRPKFEVKNCFEVYHDSQKTIAHVLPGKWDITTSEPVDQIVIEGTTMTLYRYTKERKAKALKEATSIPFTFDELAHIGEFLVEKRAILDALLLVADPVFVRGHEEPNGTLTFANLRKTSALDFTHTLTGSFYTIRSKEDALNWDKKSVPFIDVPVDSRTQDTTLHVIANILGKTKCTVYTKSLLSHQAIVLREAGLTVKQHLHENEYEIRKRKLA